MPTYMERRCRNHVTLWIEYGKFEQPRGKRQQHKRTFAQRQKEDITAYSEYLRSLIRVDGGECKMIILRAETKRLGL